VQRPFTAVNRCRSDDFWRRSATTDRRDDLSAGHETHAALVVVGREESRRRRHRVGCNGPVQLSDRIARLRHTVPGRRHSAHRYDASCTTAVLSVRKTYRRAPQWRRDPFSGVNSFLSGAHDSFNVTIWYDTANTVPYYCLLSAVILYTN